MNDSPSLTMPVSERDHIQGSPEASLTLVEYGDYQCPYCRMAYPVVKKLQKKLRKNLRFVFRNFPLTQAHPYALIAAQAAEAAALQGKFWEMHDLVFEQQPSLSPQIIPVWAKKLGLDLEKFGSDLMEKGVAKQIAEDRESGIRSDVNGTPTFFINGTRHDDAPDYDTLLAALESGLALLSHE